MTNDSIFSPSSKILTSCFFPGYKCRSVIPEHYEVLSHSASSCEPCKVLLTINSTNRPFLSSFHTNSSKFIFNSNPQRFTEVCFSGEEDESHLEAVEVMAEQEVRLKKIYLMVIQNIIDHGKVCFQSIKIAKH